MEVVQILPDLSWKKCSIVFSKLFPFGLIIQFLRICVITHQTGLLLTPVDARGTANPRNQKSTSSNLNQRLCQKVKNIVCGHSCRIRLLMQELPTSESRNETFSSFLVRCFVLLGDRGQMCSFQDTKLILRDITYASFVMLGDRYFIYCLQPT